MGSSHLPIDHSKIYFKDLGKVYVWFNCQAFMECITTAQTGHFQEIGPASLMKGVFWIWEGMV